MKPWHLNSNKIRFSRGTNIGFIYFTTHTGLQQLPPLRLQVKHHTSPGSRQSGASDQEDEKHDVGQRGGHPHDLARKKRAQSEKEKQEDGGN